MSTIFHLKDFGSHYNKISNSLSGFSNLLFKIIRKIAININKIITCNYGDIAYLLQLIQNH